MSRRIAVFAGTFDPITLGHVDIVRRALDLFDEVVVAIGVNSNKKTLFSTEQRMAWVKACFPGESRLTVDSYEGLTVEFCKTKGAKFLVRGLRNGTDFDYEAHIAQLNKSLWNEVETVFVLSAPELSYISSTLVRDVIAHKGNYQQYLPEAVQF